MFTERKLMTLAGIGVLSDVLDRPVSEFLEIAYTVELDRSVYEVAKALGRNDLVAVLVVEHDEPKGIITDYDIAGFLALWSEGIALLEDIEKRLRAAIERVFVTPESRAAAIYQALGRDNSYSTRPAKEYEELTLPEHEQLIICAKCWDRFQPLLQSKSLFMNIVASVKPIRNQVAHFRGDLTVSQRKTLREVASWLFERQISWTKDADDKKALKAEYEKISALVASLSDEEFRSTFEL